MEMDRLLKWHNGAKTTPTFSPVEMTPREDDLRRHLAEAKLDAVVPTSYHNINYFSDFLHCSFGRPYGFAITDRKATSISAGIDGGQPYRRTFGYGHSFGALCRCYGWQAGVELREDIETVLKPNMVVSMEPMITPPEGLPGAGGYREHDLLVLTESGAESTTEFPFGPECNIIRHGFIGEIP